MWVELHEYWGEEHAHVSGVVSQLARCSTHGIPYLPLYWPDRDEDSLSGTSQRCKLGWDLQATGAWSVLCEDKQDCLELRQGTGGTGDNLSFCKAKGSSVYPTGAAALVMNRR